MAKMVMRQTVARRRARRRSLSLEGTLDTDLCLVGAKSLVATLEECTSRMLVKDNAERMLQQRLVYDARLGYLVLKRRSPVSPTPGRT